ncbi:hypothetical protein THMIRHAT_23340 [Thiosulfativibrio zosterae]|uniref:Diguanylate cyclase n=2 Tax=Thiosulfativibrio zosterae TaxID=2675053 RepID=A0A6F8PRD5_9GAMM|nr:hypothetical protein THMIRHAT_23340 [Thiosulfativibrio zosterae]
MQIGLLLALMGISSLSVAERTLNLGIYAHLDEASMHQKYGPLVDYLNAALPGIHINYQVLPAKELRESIHKNQFDLLFTNPSLYQIIRYENSLGGAIATVQTLHHGQAVSSLGGVIFTRADAGLKTLKQLEKQTVAVPGFSNTGAYRIPLYELFHQGVNKEAISFITVGNNDDVVRAVLEGVAKAGFVRTGILESWFKQGQLTPADITVLNQKKLGSFPFLLSTDLFPEWPFFALSHVSDKDIKALSVALFNLKASDPAAKAAGIAGFVPALDYLSFETLLRELHLYPFDVKPEFSLKAFWQVYALEIKAALAAAILVLVLLVLSGWLSFKLKKTAQKAKQESERVQSFIEATQSGTWEWQVETGEVCFNYYWAASLGYELTELKPHVETFFELIHPDDLPRVQQALTEHFSGAKNIMDIEVRLRHKDGSWRWMLDRGQVLVWNEQHQPLVMSGTHTDITQSKQQQMALQRKADRDAVFLELPYWLEKHNEAEFLQAMLDRLEDLTQSGASFIHGYEEATDTIHLLSWSRRTLQTYCHMDKMSMHYPLKDAGIWADCVRQKRAIMVNDYESAHSDHKKGFPEGHAQLERFLTVPVFDKSQVVMLLGVANKPEPYNAEDVEDVQLLGNEVYRLLQISRNQQKLQQAANVFKFSQEGIVMTDASVNIVEMNATYLKMCGYRREELLGQNPRILSSGRQDAIFYAQMWKEIFDEGFWKGEIWNRHKSGAVYPQLAHISAVKNAEGHVTHYIGLFSDISTQKNQQAALEKIAHYDALTQLPNRTLLTDRLEQAMARAKRNGKMLAVGFMDLDGFKEVNDTYGHEAGDYLLVALSKRFQKLLRAEDTIARLGGDEFVLVIVDLVRAEQVKGLLQRILEETLVAVHYEGAQLQVSVSIGISFYAPETDSHLTFDMLNDLDADQLIRQADQAMYRAKNLGKNQVVVFQDHFSNVINEGNLSKEVSAALDNHEFCLYYQPKVNLRKGKIDSFEALIRWQHPRKGFLTPQHFLEGITSPEVKIKMSFWVIRSVLKQMLVWQKFSNSSSDFADVLLQKMVQDPRDFSISVFADMRVSVNVDAVTLEHPEFVSHLKVLLDEFPQIHPSFLTLEILESSALQDIKQISSVIMATRALGVNFAIDDFGVGYASLHYLRDLPVHELKVDQTFISTLLEQSQSLSILEAILGMSEAFAHQVIAEGVETPEHCKILQQLGYELVQGYAISRPMPAEAVVEWIETWEPDPSWANNSPLSRAGRSLLIAMIEHRIWVDQLQKWVLEASSKLPELNAVHCRFGEWFSLQSPKLLDKKINRQLLNDIHLQHLEIHAKANQLVEMVRQKDSEKVQTHLSELLVMRDNILAALEAVAIKLP